MALSPAGYVSHPGRLLWRGCDVCGAGDDYGAIAVSAAVPAAGERGGMGLLVSPLEVRGRVGVTTAVGAMSLMGAMHGLNCARQAAAGC